MKDYDVILVGAGNAGLTCAASLASKGMRILLLERNSVPGGCATSFCRGRFEFETSLHELANIGTKEDPGSIRKMFEAFGADIDWKCESNAYRTITDGKNGYDVTMPTGVKNFCDEMERQVPGSRESTEMVFELAKKTDEAVNYLSKGNPDPKVMVSRHLDFMRMASHSVSECLDALEMPKKAQNIFNTYWPYLGASVEELDFAHYVMMVERYVLKSPAMPSMKSHELSLALEKVIRNFGGEIRYNEEVNEILIKDGKAYGVKVGNREIYSDYVVANCFPDNVFKHMKGRSDVPERAVKLMNSRKNGFMFFTVYLGLNRTNKELGIKDYSVFLFGDPSAEKQYENCRDAEKSGIIVNCLNCVVPDSSPKGTSTLFLTTVFRENAWGDVKPQDYKRIKNKIAERMIETYESKTGIKVKEHIEEIVIAAPPTFARYLNTPQGTPYGYEIKSFDTMLARIMNSKNERFVKNLYFVGAHGERADGYSSTYADGNTTAARIAREVQSK